MAASGQVNARMDLRIIANLQGFFKASNTSELVRRSLTYLHDNLISNGLIEEPIQNTLAAVEFLKKELPSVKFNPIASARLAQGEPDPPMILNTVDISAIMKKHHELESKRNGSSSL